MIKSGGKLKAAGAFALLLTLAPAPLPAQTVPDFSLPRTRPTSAGGAQGPVDEDNPVVRPAPRPTPTPPPVVFAPSPSPSASQPSAIQPQTTGTPTTAPRSAPNNAQRPTGPTPRTGAASAPSSQASGAAAAPSIGDQTTPTLPTLPTTPTVAATDSFALPQVSESASTSGASWYWPWIAGAAALLAAVFGLLLWRRRKTAAASFEFERPVVPQTEPETQPEPQPVATMEQPVSAPAPRPTPKQSGLTISLEARRMNASLVATTLNYVLTLTNTTDQALMALAVEGDMIAAHGSLPTEKQIASDTDRLELRHALVTLEPGESAEFTGDFRLPLATLVPIRAGDAAYFVPLARWRVEASTSAGAPLVQVQTFVIGELPEQSGAALRPFRLDLGPRTYSRIGQRAVS